MDIDRIRQALEWELGEGYSVSRSRYLRGGIVISQIRGGVHHTIVNLHPDEFAAIGRALQSAAGEPMIPLREAVRVVVEACMSERRRCEGDYYGDMYGGAAIDGVEENAIAALQALGGGEND